MLNIIFENGTLRLENTDSDIERLLGEYIVYDPRSRGFRARACDYASIVLALCSRGIKFDDRARQFAPACFALARDLKLRDHQQKALADWVKADCRGIVALPTGAGKTILAVFAMLKVRRPTIILVPTLDLLAQWVTVIEETLNVRAGRLGGGEREIAEITVSTYDSAVLNMEFIGNRFGFLIADECHHLPGPTYKMAALQSIAPFRLGLSATPESGDDREDLLLDLMGGVVHYAGIRDLADKVLSPYEVKRLEIPLEPEEKIEYAKYRSIYLDFLKKCNINFSMPNAWQHFLGQAARSIEGKNAFAAFLKQRRIARSGRGKLAALWQIINQHVQEQIIVFTAENETAYAIGNTFRLPTLTCQTKLAERKDFLDKFRKGDYPVMVTSRVLNEGVDVPAAGVGVVFSGSASVREHVQRLGRILRPSPGKAQAVLYELLSADTGELSVSSRRRQHSAYMKGFQ